MMNRSLYRFRIFALALILCLTAGGLSAQTQKKGTGTKAPVKKTAPGQQGKKSTPGDQNPSRKNASSIPADKLDAYREQAIQMVKFYENTLNFLADKNNTVKEKETIINESYLKFFWDDKVQIEDDLDPKRLVPLYKDVQAYLSDVDFFFKRARFTYQVQDVNVMTNIDQKTFFTVTANRNLAGVTVNNDSINNNQVRYFELNYDDSKQELMIVSIYTTKLNEKDDLRNWWNGLPSAWKLLLGKDQIVQDGVPLGHVSTFNDTTAVVDSMPVKLVDSRIYGLLVKIIDTRELDLSGNTAITTLDPLAKLSSLTSLNLSGTGISDLMPLRNLNALSALNCAGTQVATLEPLKYCSHIKQVDLSKTPLADPASLAWFPALQTVNISNTAVTGIGPLKDLNQITELRINNTGITDLSPLAGLTAIQILDFSNTPVSDIGVLKNLTALQKVYFNHSKVATLDPLNELTTLTAVYCDNTLIKKTAAIDFMLAHRGLVVIFDTDELTSWWNTMSADWKKVFSYYAKMDAPPTKEQLHALMTIDSINISGRMSIESLQPLSLIALLQTLNCSNTSVNSFAPLSALSALKLIDAHNSKVSSLQGLGKMQKLETLLLDNSEVKDLSPVSGLPALKLIEADNTGITTEQGMAFNEKNPGCVLIYRTFENTDWWKGLSEAWKNAILAQTGFKGDPDKFQLEEIANLEKLTIDQNTQIVTVQPALYLTKLKEFRFSDTRVTSLEPLSRMTWVKSLRFPKNPIIDLTPLSRLTQLTELDCENTQVENLQPIMNLQGLEILRISGTPVKNLKYIAGLRNLRVLDMYNTKINNIDILDPFQKLESLKIFNTKISQKKVDAFKVKHPGCEVIFY
jgi:Leucine-rich repeat (LRR) protein